ncbi:MAG: beta-ketoacyl-ACP synthase II [Bacillota bacterium]|nr:beta-ketoacyl-ACP synthase II [Bacillota bacterium]
MRRRVAVTGMGIISPIGNAIKDFKEAIFTSKCGIAQITRFNTDDFRVHIGAEVKGFNPENYFDKGEVRRVDPFSQFAMAAATEAMEMSGLMQSGFDSCRAGVFIGSGIGGMLSVAKELERLNAGGPSKVSPFMIPMMISNMASGLIAIRFKAKGPCLPIVTACATGTHSVGEAFHSIKDGYTDIVITGGTEGPITPIGLAGFTNMLALSLRNDPASSSIPFDKRRDGFVMGEGAAVIVLEEYEHAKARGAKVYAEICGYGSTDDAYHMTAPDPEGEGSANAIRLAMAEAGISPEDVGYINAHGTSTPINDRIETMAIKRALGKAASRVAVSSTKSMTGHMLGAAGTAEAIATVLALYEGILPPTIGYKEFDPECDLDVVPNTARKVQVEYAASNSLGFGGHNATLIFKQV